MVPGRANEREAVVGAAVEHRVGDREDAAGGEQRRLPGVGADPGLGADRREPALGTRLLDPLDHRRLVDELELGAARAAGVESVELREHAGLIEHGDRPLLPLGALEVRHVEPLRRRAADQHRAVVVGEAALVVEEDSGGHAATTPPRDLAQHPCLPTRHDKASSHRRYDFVPRRSSSSWLERAES